MAQKNSQTFVINCRNISSERRSHFCIHPREVNSARLKGDIIAFYHSHPEGGDHSRKDTLISEKLKLPSILYNIPEDAFSTYHPTGIKIPLLGRPYIMGTLDCIELVRDYYEQNLNIVLPEGIQSTVEEHRYVENYAMSPYNNQFNANVLLDYFKTMGFYPVSQLKKNDVLIFNNKGIVPACHCAIYIGGGKIMTQYINSPSKVKNIRHIVEKGKIFRYACNILRIN